MDALPDEILTHIFEFFDMQSKAVMSKVSRRWMNIIHHTPRLNSHFVMTDLSDLKFLKWWPRSVDIKTMVVDAPVDLINTLLEDLEDTCPNIRSLTISKCNLLSERHVHRLMKCFPLLESIDIFLTSFYIPSWFVDKLSNMKVVVLNNRLDDTALRVISEKCTKLKELHMYGYVKFYPLPHLQNILSLRYETLTKLTLRCCELNDKTCMLIGQCRNLVKLYMYNCWLMTDNGISYLSSLQYLKTLHMTGLKLITMKGFEFFLNNLKMDAITELNFSSTVFNDNHAMLLCKKKMYLQTLELWNCPKLTEQGINKIIDSFKELDILDINITLNSDTFKRIVYETKISFLRFDTSTSDVLQMWKLMQHRLVGVDNATLCSDELYYRGSAEGYRANYVSYMSQYKLRY